MESADQEVLGRLGQWLDAGREATLVTVARARGGSPRPPGSLFAVADDGAFCGSVSGGCVETDLAGRLARGAPATPETLEYGVTADDARRFGLPCGGRLELVLEPLHGPEAIAPVSAALAERRRIRRRLHLDDGRVELLAADRDDGLYYDGAVLERVFGPAWRLLLIGAGQLSRQVAQMATALDYEVIVCDPREEFAGNWEVPEARLETRMPDAAVRALASDPRSAVVALSHDPRLDDPALLEALPSPAFYVGALGSRRNNAGRVERLREMGVGADQVARLHGPVGLPLGGRTPGEIAVSILSELTAVRHGAALGGSAGAARGG